MKTNQSPKREGIKTTEEWAMPMLAVLVAKNGAARSKRIKALQQVHQRQRELERGTGK